MKDKVNRSLQKSVRVREFGTAHTADFAADSLAAQTFAALASDIEEINTLAAAEVSARGDQRQGTEGRAQARAELRDDLEAIRRTARAMEDELPGITDKFRIPRNNNDNELLSAARAFLAAATPLKARFIAHELPADFLEDLQADIEAFEAATNDQSSGVGNHVAANAAIDSVMARGLERCRKLDAMMRNKYANNPAVLAEWTSANHTERAPRKAKPDEPPEKQ